MNKWKVLSIKKNFTSEEDVVNELLLLRNIKKQETESFLKPSIKDISVEKSGISKKELQKAKDRINEAVKNKEKIIILGDYDVDGICASAILWETIYKKYKNVLPYIPDRFTEGYGITKKSLRNILEKYPDVKLIITVDNGIVAYDAIKFSQENGVDVIVTDHHVANEKAPNSFAIVHTIKLCGAGVSWVLARELKFLGEKEINEKLELACLATVADLVPLVDLNRAIVATGLNYLRKTKRPGLLEIYKLSGIDKDTIGVYQIGHIIAPRLNATGRIYHAIDSLRLLCSSDKVFASKIANLLEKTNKKRQQMVVESVQHAKLSVVAKGKLGKIIGVHSESYSEGIVGLVSSRLVEEYYRPSFTISVKKDISKGSARSISGVNIVELLRSVKHLLKEVGGHPMAAGFSIETEKIEEFYMVLEEKMSEIEDNIFQKIINVDMEITSGLLTKSLYDKIQKLSPFGIGNPEPTFIIRSLTINNLRRLGQDGSHLKLTLSAGEKIIEGIGFGMGDSKVSINDKIDALFTLEENIWNGNSTLQLKLRDLSLQK